MTKHNTRLNHLRVALAFGALLYASPGIAQRMPPHPQTSSAQSARPTGAVQSNRDVAPRPDAPPRPELTAWPKADVEVDPTAYVLDGYSLHVGIASGHLRLDLGAYAIAIPEAIHGNADFKLSASGYGAKLQCYFSERRAGGFVGVDSGFIRTLARRQGSDLAAQDDAVSAGVNAGWRFNIVSGFYATPWLGVSYSFGSEDIELGGETYEANPWTLFPAVHLGYAFR